MQKILLFAGFIIILIALEFFAKSLRSEAKRNNLKQIFLKFKYKIQNFYRHFTGKRELKVAGVRFNIHDRFIIFMFLGIFFVSQSLFMGYDTSGGLASILHSNETLFKRKFAQTYEASNYPTRISDVVYKINFEGESHHVSSPEKLGRVVTDGYASGGAAMYADSEEVEQGLLAKTTINNVQPKGEYSANFNLKIPKGTLNDLPVAILEIFDTQTGKYLAQKKVSSSEFKTKGTYQNFEIPFIKTLTGNTQYRVLFTDQSPLWLDKISIDPQFDNWVIYDPKLYYDNVENEDGFSPFVREGAALRDLRGHITKVKLKEGLPSGTYTATFRMKTKNINVDQPIAKIEVHDKGQKTQYFNKVIEATDFDLENEYREFEVEFKVTKLSKIELSVFFFDAPESDLYVDVISVKNF